MSRLPERVLDAIDAWERFEYYGLRVEDGRVLEVGQTAPPSRRWEDDQVTDDLLDGTSAVRLSRPGQLPTLAAIRAALVALRSYFGDQIVVLGGDNAEHGEDEGEIVIDDATVLAVLAR